mgnify:CR=1 FL=1
MRWGAWAAAALLAVAGSLLPLACEGPAEVKAASFYRLRVELTTSSNGVALEPATTEGILSVREVATQGLYEKKGVTMPRIWVLWDGNGRQGESLGIVADYAVTPEALAGPLPFTVRADGPEGCWVRVTGAGEGEEMPLAEVESEGAKPLEFALDLSPLRDAPPLTDEAPPVVASTATPLALALYYPWYGSLRDWDSPTLQDRPAQPYVSDDREAMERHVAQAQEAGIDGFLVSWWGPGSYSDENLAVLLEVAEEKGFLIAINFETLRGDSPPGNPIPIPPTEISSWLSYAIGNHGDHPAYLKVEGEPLIVFWASQAVPLFEWESIFSGLSDRGLDAFCLAEFGGDHPKTDVLEVFDGLYIYNIVGMAGGERGMEKLASVYADTGRMVANYHLLQEEGVSRKLWAATAQPGYDDHLIPSRPGMVLPREEGATYRASLDAALASDPGLLFVTSWNEWWEHTYIEPSEDCGGLYLRITAEYLNAG